MNRGSFTFKITMGIWEGELLVKALENYKPRKADEKCSKQDLIGQLRYQMEQQKKKNQQNA